MRTHREAGELPGNREALDRRDRHGRSEDLQGIRRLNSQQLVRRAVEAYAQLFKSADGRRGLPSGNAAEVP